jgi:hypothetical protein
MPPISPVQCRNRLLRKTNCHFFSPQIQGFTACADEDCSRLHILAHWLPSVQSNRAEQSKNSRGEEHKREEHKQSKAERSQAKRSTAEDTAEELISLAEQKSTPHHSRVTAQASTKPHCTAQQSTAELAASHSTAELAASRSRAQLKRAQQSRAQNIEQSAYR